MGTPCRLALRRASCGLVAALISMTACAAASTAAPSPTPDGLTTFWDGPTLNLDWQGGTYTTVSGTFVGTPISVPGDEAWRTLRIRNDGPCNGTLTVDIASAAAHLPGGTVNADLPDLINLGWEVGGVQTKKTFASVIAAGGTERLASVPLARGGEIPLIMGYEFPYDETGGRNLGLPSTELTFSVRITITGDETCVSPSPGRPSPSSPTPSVPLSPPPASGSGPAMSEPPVLPSGTAAPGETPRRSGVAVPPTSTGTLPPGSLSPGTTPGTLPQTGATVVTTALLAALLLLLGLAARRRRAREDF